MESDATWWVESPNGQEISGSGLSATLRVGNPVEDERDSGLKPNTIPL